MLSPLPSERRRSPRLQTLPNLADLEWQDRSQARSSQGNILNISPHGALVFSDSFPGLGATGKRDTMGKRESGTRRESGTGPDGKAGQEAGRPRRRPSDLQPGEAF
jgi:hypothetical protein